MPAIFFLCLSPAAAQTPPQHPVSTESLKPAFSPYKESEHGEWKAVDPAKLVIPEFKFKGHQWEYACFHPVFRYAHSFGWEVDFHDRFNWDIHLRNATLAQILDALVSQAEGYAWRVSSGVINVYPTSLTGTKQALSILDHKLNGFQCKGLLYDVGDAALLLSAEAERRGLSVSVSESGRELLRRYPVEVATDHMSYPDNTRNLALDIKGPISIRDTLNAIVSADPPNFWIASVGDSSGGKLSFRAFEGHDHRAYIEREKRRITRQYYLEDEARYEPHEHKRFKRLPLDEIVRRFSINGNLELLTTDQMIVNNAIVGLEYDTDDEMPDISLDAGVVSLPRFLDAVMGKSGPYAWSERDGVIDIYPRRWPEVSRRLDRMVPPFHVEGYDLENTALALFNVLLANGWKVLNQAQPDPNLLDVTPKEERISFEIKKPTPLRQVLNLLVQKDPPARWVAGLGHARMPWKRERDEDYLDLVVERIRKKRE